ncbi:MAG: hypothetical protein IRZ26_09300 [Clostridia bacterium]|nr:hypothetical protein [Clostridia bacterium]MCL6521041.1 hypothetical protein [Bacillota bacterium]
MIVRIQTEHQYRLEGEALRRLDEEDNRLLEAVRSGDEAAFREAFSRVLTLVRTEGEPLPATFLGPSDVILPPPETSLEEARQILANYPDDLPER